MKIALYMFYIADQHRAFLWNYEEREDAAAVKRAEEHLRVKNATMGKLFRGPTGVDEMKFVGNVTIPG